MKINWGKTLSTILLCTFLLNTLSPIIIFAQEATQSVNDSLEILIDTTDNIPPKTDTPKNVSIESPVKKQPVIKEKDTTKEVTPQVALPASESELSTTQLAATASTTTESPGPGEIKSPDNPLNTNASYQTSLLTGSATYEYSIPVPPGTNGLTPEVKLSYNSMGASGKEGMLGMGWSLNNSYVYRDPNYSVNDVSNDIYKLVLNGTSYDLVYDISTQLYRTEIESNIWIKYYLTDGGNQLGSYWEVKTKEGTSYKFGNSLDSESVCLNRNYVTRWHLKTVTDINSNNIYFTYLENLSINDIGTTYLSRISYNNDLSRSIEFIYNDKQYSVLSFEQGCSLRESKYLKEIQTKIGNTLNKKFEIEYDLNNPRLLLLSLQEKDGAGVGLPKIKFEYYKGNIGSFTSSPNFSSSTQTYFMDFDRDGLPERFLNVTNRSQYQENDGNMILPTILSMDSKLQYGKFIDNDYQFLDFNADGFVDYINSYFYPPDAGYKRDWFFYSGDGKGQFSHVYTIPKSQAITASSYKGVRIVDLNGDSFPDIVYQEKSFVNVGSNWIQKTEWNIPRFYDSRNNIISSQHYLHDINGDGFVDFVDAGESIDIGGIRYSAVYLNTGSHFLTTKTQFNIYEPRFAQPASILVDIDNDGLIDILQSYDSTNGNERIPWIVYKNNGKGGWQTPETWIAPTTYSLAKFTSLNDINGDGLLDLANYSYGDALLNTSEPRINMLKKITNTLGGITEIEYTPSTKFDNTGGDGVSDLGFPVYAVTKITENDGVGATTNATTYAYKNGLYDYQDREFRGFGQVTSTNSEGTVTEHYFKQDDALKGNEYKTIVKDTSNKPYQETQNTWSSVLNAGVYTNRLITSDSFSYDGISSNPKQTKVTYEYDPYGNVTKEKIWGDISVTGDEMTTTTAYVYNPAKWILSKPKNTFVTNWLNTKVREGWFYYDNSIDNNALPVKGLLTKEEQWNNTGSNVVQKYEYNTFGNITKNIDPLNRNILFEYDATNTFQTKITNPKTQSINITYDPATGNKLTETDPNGLVKSYIYDSFGRILKEIFPFDSATYPTLQYLYSTDGIAPEMVKVSRREKAGLTGTIDAYTFVDGFGRVIQTRSEAEDSTKHVVTSFVYNGFGKVEKQILPYFENVSQVYVKPASSLKSVKINFDPTGRAVKVINPDNTFQTFGYDHWKLTLTDANNHKKVQYLNAYNQITKVEEYLGSSIFNTLYEYQFPGGNVTKITDSKGSQIKFEYDSLGRNIKLIDHSLGTWIYTYDVIGNMLTQKDNRGITISTTYDVLNRPVLVNYPTDTDISFVYDREKIGTLSQITDGTGVTKYTYDNRLRTIKEEKNIITQAGSNTLNKSFVTENTYDSADRVVSTKYPVQVGATVGEVKNYTFNNQGQIETMNGLLANINYNHLNKITRKDFGNGLNTTYTYNTTTERLGEIKTANSTGTSLQNFKYIYDKVGNVNSIQDVIKATTQIFTYDDLERLITALEYGSYDHIYKYDSVGNILSVDTESGLKQYYYEDPVRPNVLTKIGYLPATARVCPVFTVEYFANTTLTGVPVLRKCETDINYDWDWGEINPYVGSNSASIRWTGDFDFEAAEYTFQTTSDDGVKLYIDNVLVINEWRAQASLNTTVKKVMTAGKHNIKLEYFEDSGPAVMKAFWKKSIDLKPGNSNSALYCSGIVNNKFCAEYYINNYLSGNPELTRVEAIINNDWGAVAPTGFSKSDYYSVRWSGNFNFQADNYVFKITPDDGIRLWIDGKIVLNEWKNQGAVEYSFNYTMSEGLHNIVVEYFEHNGGAIAKVNWAKIITNVALNKPGTASTAYSGTINAVDGNLGTSWGSGRKATSTNTDWIKIDLQGIYGIEQIKLYVDQSPSGLTSHRVLSSTDCTNWSQVWNLQSTTYSGDILTINNTFNAKCIKVETLSSVSWTAWKEIEVYSKGLSMNIQSTIPSKTVSNSLSNDGLIQTGSGSTVLGTGSGSSITQELEFRSPAQKLTITPAVKYTEVVVVKKSLQNVKPTPAVTPKPVPSVQPTTSKASSSTNTLNANSLQALTIQGTNTQVGYVYDANGNLVSDNTFCYQYNDANKVSKVKKCLDSSLIAEYIYDSAGQRVIKKTYNNGVFVKVTVDIADIYDYSLNANNTAESNTYYRANNELIAKRTVIQSPSKDEITYYHNDHLGSASIVTNSTGAKVEETRYYPYGEVREGGTQKLSGKYTYTGQESDSETGLMYYGARYYNAGIGRFVQPDSMLPNMYDPQGLNRYIYVKNNPLKYTDPTGNFWEYGLDALTISYDVAAFSQDSSIENGAYLFVDVVLAVIPVVPAGVGPVAKGVKALSKVDDVVDAGKGAVAVTKAVTNTGELPTYPKEVWDQKALDNITPGSATNTKQTRYNPSTGKYEHSDVTYDEFGRQVERVDYTDHGTPKEHTDPHKVEYKYNPSSGNPRAENPVRTEIRYDYNKATGNYTQRPKIKSGCGVNMSCR